MLHLIILRRMLTLLNLTLRPILKILLHQTTRPIVRLPDIPRQVFLELTEHNPYQFQHLKRIFLCIEMERLPRRLTLPQLTLQIITDTV